MPWATDLRRRLKMLLRRSQAEQDLDDEMRLHVELRGEQLRAGGLEAGDARTEARRRFGNTTRLREESIDAWGWRWLEQFTQDVRFGARTLLRSPLFSLTAILTLALATGATTAIFSILNGVVLRPLPFADPDRLVQLYGRAWREDRGAPDPLDAPLSAAEIEAYARSRSVQQLAAYAVTARLLQGASGLERLPAVTLDVNAFDLLGVHAVVGRTFRADDPPDVAVISARLWERQFARDPAVAGRVATVDGRRVTILGVMPDWFQFPYRAASLLPGAAPETRTDVWTPLAPRAGQSGPGQPAPRGRMHVVARLNEGVSIEAAAAELAVIAREVERQYRTRVQAPAARVEVRVAPLADEVIGPIRPSLWLLFAAVGLVLAAACANVANLMLARTTARAREVVTRAALGAGRFRLVRQFLAESLMLSLAGGLLGLVVARWGTGLLMSLGAERLPRAHEVTLDWQAFAFLLLACVATAVLFGLAPAIAAARMDAHGISRDWGHATASRRFRMLRDGLVVLEVALAFVLGAGAGLVIREIARLRDVDTGMTTGNVLTLHLTPRAPAADYYAIEQRVAQLPGVRAAGLTQLIPLQNWGWEGAFEIKGRPASSQRRQSELRYVTPGYFRALGIPLVRGRWFDAGDTADAPRVILINEALARQYLSGEDPIGVALDRGTIVGVVGDVRQAGLQRPPGAEIYYPAAQNVTMTADSGMSLLVRTSGPPETITAAVRAAVGEVNSGLAIFNVKTMDAVVDESLWALNLYRWLIGAFAILTLTLAAIGLYGVVSYMATARTREFAIRLALGSSPRALARLVVSRALWLTGAGLGCGAIATMMLSSAFQRLPVAGGPDPITCAAIAVVLLAIALAACASPAVRATAVNPVTALRAE